MTLPTYKRTILAATAGAALLMTAACGGGDEPASASGSSSASSAPSEDSSDSSASSSYKAGEYEAEGSYQNPGGTSSVKVKVDLGEDGTISEVEVTPEASGTSLQYQQKFVSGIKAEVVGKKIDDLDVSKVAGSSLTSGAYTEAIDSSTGDAQA